MVHPSWVQIPSIAWNVLAPVLAIRNTPAWDSTSAEPPTSFNVDPAVAIWTTEPPVVNRPARTGSVDATPLGDVGDDDASPQAEASVASVAQEASWHASAQKSRRETGP